MRRLSIEWDNALAALTFFDADEDGVDKVLRLCVSIHQFLGMTVRREVIPFLETALEKGADVTPSLRGWSLIALGELWNTESVGREDLTQWVRKFARLFEEVEPLARDVGDVTLLAWAVGGQGHMAGLLGDKESASNLVRLATDIAEGSSDEGIIGWLKLRRAQQSPRGERVAILNETIEYFRRTQNLRGLEQALEEVAVESQFTGASVTETLRLAQESVEVAEELGDDLALGPRLTNLSIWSFMAGQFEDARLIARRALMLYRRQGRSPLATAGPLLTLAWCATHDGDLERRAQLTAVFDNLVDDSPVEIWSWSPAEGAARDDNVSHLIDELGPEEYERQRRLSLRLSFDQAVNLALGRTGSPS